MEIAKRAMVTTACFQSGDVRTMLLEALTPACTAKTYESGLSEHLGWPLHVLNQFFCDPELFPFYSDFAQGYGIDIEARVHLALTKYTTKNVPLPEPPKNKKNKKKKSAGAKEGKYSTAVAMDEDGDESTPLTPPDGRDYAYDDQVGWFMVCCCCTHASRLL